MNKKKKVKYPIASYSDLSLQQQNSSNVYLPFQPGSCDSDYAQTAKRMPTKSIVRSLPPSRSRSSVMKKNVDSAKEKHNASGANLFSVWSTWRLPSSEWNLSQTPSLSECNFESQKNTCNSSSRFSSLYE